MTEETLNSIMEFDHVIRVSADGTIEDSEENFYSEIVHELVDADAERWELRVDMTKGWTLLSGFTGQYSYNGPVMHDSEYIGGGLERHIRENPGHYVAIYVTSDCQGKRDFCAADYENDGCQCEPEGWVVAFKPIPESELAAARARIALQAYYNTHDEGSYGDEGSDCFVSAVQDLLTDLRHLVWGSAGLDFEQIDAQASNRYCEELEVEDDDVEETAAKSD